MERNYGVPFDNGATIMAIRKDMVEAAGLTVDDFKDTTWSDFIEKAKKVVETNNVPMLTSSGGSEIIIEMLQSAGASPMVDGKVDLVNNKLLRKQSRHTNSSSTKESWLITLTGISTSLL